MSTVPMPDITYKPKLPESILKDGRISAVQLEAVAIAGQQNSIVLPGGARGSALIGDGTGVGKGREGASILLDNWRQGRKRLVWVSEKWDLMQDAMRDLKGIGADDLVKTVKAFAKFNATTPIDHQGVLFTTYALIRSADKKGNTRVSQLAQWLRGKDEADGAYILYDESHNLKNAVAAQGMDVSQIGKAVKEDLMAKLPNLRSVSLSATAATDVMNLGYLDRLGLWGPGTAFPNGFMEFANQIGQGGMSAMEMVARELKAQGKYVSRTLSFKGVTYREVEHPLNADQKELYRTAAKAWKQISSSVEDTIKSTTRGGGLQKARAMSQFYSAQQRFFNVLITTLKVPTAIEQAQKGLAEGKSVVITLVNTNEAAQNREKNRFRESADPDEIPEYDFGPKEMLMEMVREHYPTQQYKDDVDSNGNPIQTPVVMTDAEGREIPVQNPEAVKERDRLLANLSKNLNMPQNPLDLLIDGLGGPAKVAELTGRKERYDPVSGKFIPRGGKDVKRDEINLSEMRGFQGGKKRVAVLSSAAGTGISLHAGNDVANQQPRLHITLQVGWSADKQMQMFGRTHRTNQAHAPEYVMLTSDLGGEKRFVSTIARRLGSLGALSKGQKNATTGSDLMEKVNFETDQGREAANSFYQHLLRYGSTIPGTDLTGMQVLDDMGVLKSQAGGGKTVPPADRTNVTRLLNRLLALDPDVQNAVYNYFYDVFQATVQAAIEAGTLDTGVKTLPGDEFSVKEQRVIAKDPKTGAETFYYPVDASVRTERMSPKDTEKKLARKSGNPRLMYKAPFKPAYYEAEKGEQEGKIGLVTEAPPIVRANGGVEKAAYIYYPNSGKGQKIPEAQLYRWKEVGEHVGEELQKLKDAVDNARYMLSSAQNSAARYPDEWAQKRLTDAQEKFDAAEKALADGTASLSDPMEWAKDLWQKVYAQAPSHDVDEHHFIGGAVMRYWNAIRDSSGQRLHIYTATDSSTGKRVVGVDIPKDQIRQLLDRITGGKSTVNAHQLHADVLNNGLTYDLEGGIQVKTGRVAREKVVQFIPPNQDVANNLKRMGIVYEKGLTPVYYLPAGDDRYDEKPQQILEKVLKEYPVKQDTPQPSIGEHLAGESGSFEPGKIGEAASAVKGYIDSISESTHIARGIQRGLETLDTQKQADALRGKRFMEKAFENGLTKNDDEAVYHHLENPEEALTPSQESVLDDMILPLREQNTELYKEASQGGLPIDNYVGRVVKGRGGLLDRVAQGVKSIGKKNTLSRTAPQLKTRTMMAIESPSGERRVVSIKGGEATMWVGGEPTTLGKIKNAKGKIVDDDETRPVSAFFDKGYFVEGPDGYDWKIGQATTKEIEANTSTRYYHSALASLVASNIQLRSAVRAQKYLESLKESDDFKEIAWRGRGNPPSGWRSTTLPQFVGYYFEPRTAEVLNQYHERIQGGDATAYDKVGAFMRVAMLVNPIMHPLNVATSWAVEKGVTGFMPQNWITLAKTGSKAVQAVLHQNDDFLAALDAGGAVQSQNQATADLAKLFFEQLADGLGKNERWALRIAKSLGFDPKHFAPILAPMHKISSKIAWASNDMFLLQAAYQFQAKHPGTSLNDALREAGRIIPEYRLPTRIGDSKFAADLMRNRWATIFGAYHYGLLKSFGEIGRSALGLHEPIGEQSKGADVRKGWDRLAMLGLLAFALFPALDELAKKLTGDKHAHVRRTGPLGVVDAVQGVASGTKDIGTAVQQVVTPAPHTKAAVEVLFNRDLYNGQEIRDPHASFDDQVSETGRWLLQQVGQLGQAYRASESESEKKKFLLGQVGIQLRRTPAEKLASDLAAHRFGVHADTPEEREKYSERHEILDALRKGNDTPLKHAIERHEITHKQAETIRHRAKLTPLQDSADRLGYSDFFKVYKVADDEEKKQLRPLLARKRASALEHGHRQEVNAAESR